MATKSTPTDPEATASTPPPAMATGYRPKALPKERKEHRVRKIRQGSDESDFSLVERDTETEIAELEERLQQLRASKAKETAKATKSGV